MARIPSKAAAVLAAAASAALLSAPWASASTSGTQTFVLTTRSTAANPVYQAVATGVISASGTMQATSTASNAPLKAKFPKGTFMLNEVSAWPAVRHHQPVDLRGRLHRHRPEVQAQQRHRQLQGDHRHRHRQPQVHRDAA